eukprot:195783-Chlamydomonas_euryale.AAC.1
MLAPTRARSLSHADTHAQRMRACAQDARDEEAVLLHHGPQVNARLGERRVARERQVVHVAALQPRRQPLALGLVGEGGVTAACHDHHALRSRHGTA